VDIEVLEAWFKGKEEELGQQLTEIDPDSSHPFENNRLRNAGWNVNEVVFGAYKETGAGFLKWLFDRGHFKVMGEYPEAQAQLLAWSRDAQGKIKKGFDHYCDGMLAGTKRIAAAIALGSARFGRLPFALSGSGLMDQLEERGERDMDRMIGQEG
jgi:hypothetical protein